MTQFPGLRSKIAGCLLGGALAEAAFASGRSFAGATQLTLYTVDGLTEALEWANDGVAADETACLWLAYLRWLDTQGEAAPSSAPAPPTRWLDRQDVMRHQRSPDPVNIHSLVTGEMGSRQRPLAVDHVGPGALQRSAPLGLVANVPPAMIERLALDAAAITHGNPAAQQPAAVFAGLIHQLAVRNESLAEAVSMAANHATALGASPLAAGLQAASGTAVDPGAAPSSAAEVLGTAVQLASNTANDDGARHFSALLAAIDAAGDSARVYAAVAGNIVGALHGDSVLPGDAVERLEGADVVVGIANRLASAMGA